VTISKREGNTYVATFSLVQGKSSARSTATPSTAMSSLAPGVRDKADAPRCPTEKDGSPFSRGFRVTFYTAEGFTGIWSYCGVEDEGNVWAARGRNSRRGYTRYGLAPNFPLPENRLSAICRPSRKGRAGASS
jgi:hypothetical protein